MHLWGRAEVCLILELTVTRTFLPTLLSPGAEAGKAGGEEDVSLSVKDSCRLFRKRHETNGV